VSQTHYSKVHYQIGTYESAVTVGHDEDADDDHIISRAKRVIFRDGRPLGLHSQVFWVERLGLGD